MWSSRFCSFRLHIGLSSLLPLLILPDITLMDLFHVGIGPGLFQLNLEFVIRVKQHGVPDALAACFTMGFSLSAVLHCYTTLATHCIAILCEVAFCYIKLSRWGNFWFNIRPMNLWGWRSILGAGCLVVWRGLLGRISRAASNLVDLLLDPPGR